VLELKGTGYRVELKGTTLNFALGFSHPIDFPLPKGITATIPADSKGTVLMLNGADKELIGQTAAKIRGLPSAGAVRRQGRALPRRARPRKGGQGRQGRQEVEAAMGMRPSSAGSAASSASARR
jgi:large subunit ribosomal protein L6